MQTFFGAYHFSGLEFMTTMEVNMVARRRAGVGTVAKSPHPET